MHGTLFSLLSATALFALATDALAVPTEPLPTAQPRMEAVEPTADASFNGTTINGVVKRWTNSGLIYDGGQAANTGDCWAKTSDQTHDNCGGKGASFDYVFMVGITYAKGKGCQYIQDTLNTKLSKNNKGGITNYLCDELFRDGNTILHFNACKGQGGDITIELHNIYPTVSGFYCPVYLDKMP